MPSSAVTPTGAVTFAVSDSSGPVHCGGGTDTLSLTAGVATCTVTSAVPASGSSYTAEATYSGDDNLNASVSAAESSPALPSGTTTAAAAPAPPVGSTTTTTPEQGSASQSGAMSPPAGYTSQQRIFDDQFSGTTLDSSKWVTYLGAAGAVWNNFGELPLPYSADNSVANGGPGDDITMYSPSQVSVDNGLTLTAQRNTNQYASTYPWISGVVTTEGKFTMPAGDWYVQVKAQMPDTSQGIWPAIWFLCGVSCPDDNELDGYGGGFLVGSDNPNELMTSDFFADQGQQQSTNNIGTDVSAGYNVYGVQFIPGQSITAYFNGQQVWQVLASSGVTIASEPYQLMMELQVAGSPTSSWHTAANSNTPTSSMKIADVQVYS